MINCLIILILLFYLTISSFRHDLLIYSILRLVKQSWDITSLLVDTSVSLITEYHFEMSYFCLPSLLGINQFGQMGMQSMGQRSTPPLPLNAPVNQVGIMVTVCITDCMHLLWASCFTFSEMWSSEYSGALNVKRICFLNLITARNLICVEESAPKAERQKY